jgi:acetyl-CoA carboxylase biotin carboxyl carrier protein
MSSKASRKDEASPGWGPGDIREILDLLEQRRISEFEMETNGFRVRIKREAIQEISSRYGATAGRVEPLPVVVGPPAIDSKVAHAPAASPEALSEAAAPVAEDLHIIKSPIVGTFYAAPGPGSSSFVKIGDVVRPGQVLCIIEAMKLMNEIEAEIAGEITRIFVENGQPVEYGQSLFGIVPSSSEPGQTSETGS